MSVEPPSSGRPTGPPSGPLSGPSQPSPSGPGDTQAGATRADSTPPPGAERPSGPPGGGPPSGTGGGGHGGGPDEPNAGAGASPGPSRPWWKSAPRVAAIAAVVVAAVVATVVLTRSGGSSGGSSEAGGEVLLQPAAKSGPDPFTGSTARGDATPASPVALPSSSASANVTRGVDGSAPGLYGGTRKVGSCDVEKQVGALQKDPARNKAFASVLGIEPSGVPGYLRALTPVRLRLDTRVTNHGYRDGAPTSYQAVLQAGTAVLVDDRGVPRVRCACGNPLLPPVAQKGTPKRTGEAWPGYQPSNVVVVSPAVQVVNKFVVYDPDGGAWFERHKGDTGTGDTKTNPPVTAPSTPPSTPPSSPSSPSSVPPSADESSSPSSPSPCVSLSAGPSSAKPCTPVSVPPSAPPSSPSSHPPSSPATQPPSSATQQSPATSEPAPPPSSSQADGGS
ncbi:hypothetical protein N4G70_26295 [Streptomyces sp. ASQP_92]|uniref:DUF6777 domain-containing protein n=1 Tax=Streptomyces sp. ASQP_92 TaxID=2979116 RepID=UPI0021C21D53|nr:DUF6777 domain-containing protein [Streptomyces sp. ASQP_92]MCT9092356.1 hypothetical protein [Streptomyces sp. ASQP_92]